jgi:hypothetical protein
MRRRRDQAQGAELLDRGRLVVHLMTHSPFYLFAGGMAHPVQPSNINDLNYIRDNGGISTVPGKGQANVKHA